MSYGSYASQASSAGRPSSGLTSKAAQDQPGGARFDIRAGGANQQLQEPRSRDGRTELDLLRDTKRSLADADYIANGTMEQLDGQTEQLERIQKDTNAIDANLDTTDHLIRGLKPFGWLRNLFRAEPQPEKNAGLSGMGRRTSQGSAAPSGGYSASSAPAPAAPSKGAARLMADEQARRDAKLGAGGQAGKLAEQQRQAAEVDKAYDDIDSLLDGLKEKSKVINRTLDQHNEMLPGLESNISRQDEKIKKQQQDMRRIMGR